MKKTWSLRGANSMNRDAEKEELKSKILSQ
jgi:hypothetical protein